MALSTATHLAPSVPVSSPAAHAHVERQSGLYDEITWVESTGGHSYI